MNFTFHAQSDPGRVRALNEDAILAQPADGELAETRGDLLVVADGMGGHQSGEVASRQTIETLSETYYRAPGDPSQALVAAIQAANRAVYDRAQAENRRGMGTTVVAAARVGEQLYVAHVGDSRLYLIRDGTIHRLTEDHSLVEEQVAAGLITPEEAEHHPHRNVISRAVGTTPDVEVELAAQSPLALQEGDELVLCSDGLTEHVKPPRILQLVQNRSPEQAARTLIQAANAAGGSDNISVIVARVGEPALSDEETVATPAAESPAPPTPESPPSAPARAPRSATGGAPRLEEGSGPGLSTALLGILGSLILVVLLGVLAWNVLGQINPSTPTPVPSATTQNNLLVTPSLTPEEGTPDSATPEPGVITDPTPSVSPEAGGTAAPTVSATPTPARSATPTP